MGPLLDLTPSVFSILSGLVSEKVGLHYGLFDRQVLQEKASARALEAGFESLLDYYYYLRYDEGGSAELEELVETLVVNETYFFREWPAIRVLVDEIIAPKCAAGRRPRIWSAACATGEEPLSLAMLLESRHLLDRVEIVASDISTNALSRARSGRFSKRAVRQVPEPSLVERYLRSDADGYRISSHLIDAIRWERRNLLVEQEDKREFDVILCRNVLIYFSDATIRVVLDRLSKMLTNDGILIVGVSESLLRYGSGFVGEERSGVFVYRKAKNDDG